MHHAIPTSPKLLGIVSGQWIAKFGPATCQGLLVYPTSGTRQDASMVVVRLDPVALVAGLYCGYGRGLGHAAGFNVVATGRASLATATSTGMSDPSS